MLVEVLLIVGHALRNCFHKTVTRISQLSSNDIVLSLRTSLIILRRFLATRLSMRGSQTLKRIGAKNSSLLHTWVDKLRRVAVVHRLSVDLLLHVGIVIMVNCDLWLASVLLLGRKVSRLLYEICLAWSSTVTIHAL